MMKAHTKTKRGIMMVGAVLLLGAAEPKSCQKSGEGEAPRPSEGTPILADVIFGEAVSAGAGCPNNSAVVTINHQTGIVDLSFSDFSARAGGGGAQIERKACTLAIPVSLPQEGVRLVVLESELSGVIDLPASANVKAASEVFFAGQVSPQVSGELSGPASGAVALASPISDLPIAATECTRDHTLRLNTSLLVKAGARAAARADILSGRLRLAVQFCPMPPPSAEPEVGLSIP